MDFQIEGYLVRNKGNGFWRYELAGHEEDTLPTYLFSDESEEWLVYQDTTTSSYRAALIVDNQIQTIVFISKDYDLPSRAWIASLFSEAEIDTRTRRALLAGRPMDASNDIGEIICSCFGVGKNTIEQTIIKKTLCTVEEVGQCLKAGTNCGSCVPELRNIIQSLSDDDKISA